MIRRLPAALAVALLAAVASVLTGPPLPAQDVGGAAPTRVAKAAFEPARVERGGTARLVIEIAIDPGWHLYAQDAGDGQRPEFTWTLPKGWAAGKLEDVSKPHEFTGFGSKEMVHEGLAILAQTFTVGADAAPGAGEIHGTGDWQVCNDSSCQFVRKVPVTAKFEVAGGAAPAAAAPAPAPDAPPSRIAKAAFDPPAAGRGGTARLVVEFEIRDGFHLYAQDASDAQRPVFTWELPKGWTAGKVEDVTKPHEFTGFGTPEMVHEKRAVVAQTFTLGPDAPLGRTELRGKAGWQVCDDSSCEFVKDAPVIASLDVTAAAAAAAPAAAPAVPAPPPAAPGGGAADAPHPQGGGWLGLLGQAVFWGLLTVLTPCVFPLLPVTVSFFSKQKGPALPRSLVYGLGIVFTITVIGLVFKSSLDVMARGWVFNAFVGVLFLVLSLSLFGLFDLRLPGFLTDWSSSKAGSGGLAGPFFMAVTLALTSFSCSMPFLATMFTQFEQGNHAQSVVGLVVYGSTMAFPFVLCSLFPTAIQAMPRAGAWMNAVKVTMGFVEFALAFKFLRTVCLNFGWDFLPRGFVLAIWAACALGAALYLFGYVVLPHDTKPDSIGVFRLIFAITFLSSAIYLFPGVSGRPLAEWIEAFLQTQSSELSVAAAPSGGHGGGTADAGHDEWPKNDWNGALERARLARRPVLFDFTGVG
jgi:thiol:disulfide interchange protein DsbD